jgi:hypothetical protein
MVGAPHPPVLKTALSDHLFNRQKINNPPNCPPTFVLMLRNFDWMLAATS